MSPSHSSGQPLPHLSDFQVSRLFYGLKEIATGPVPGGGHSLCVLSPQQYHRVSAHMSSRTHSIAGTPPSFCPLFVPLLPAQRWLYGWDGILDTSTQINAKFSSSPNSPYHWPLTQNSEGLHGLPCYVPAAPVEMAAGVAPGERDACRLGPSKGKVVPAYLGEQAALSCLDPREPKSQSLSSSCSAGGSKA